MPSLLESNEGIFLVLVSKIGGGQASILQRIERVLVPSIPAIFAVQQSQNRGKLRTNHD